MTTLAGTPAFFGPAEARLFGWVHEAGGAAATGVVICNPFGFEEVCSHRSLRLLAIASAAAGMPALRFDAPGCGNSQGDESAPQRLQAWVASVGEAIEHLKLSTGVTRVCLVGLRLGATLAALAAAERADVTGLVAIAPVVKGRDLVRELRMMAASAAAVAPAGDGSLESAGFVLTAETVAALERVDLPGATVPPAARVLIVDRDDLPGSGAWPAALSRLGVQVTAPSWPGYAAMMTNPQDAVVPQAIVDGVVATLVEWGAHAAPAAAAFATAPAAAGAVAPPGRAEPTFSETAVRIDAAGVELFGVLALPADGAPRDRQPVRQGVLMLNSGSVHHIGPNRLWVVLARRWAQRGLAVLRLDLSGIGDSPARPGERDNVVYTASAGRDIAEALAWMRGQGIERCHLLGLCSGAFHAFQAAAAGLPVAASTMINPLTYTWEDGLRLGNALNDYEVLESTQRYRRQLLSPNTWWRLLRGELDLRMIGAKVARRAGAALAAALHRLGPAHAKGLGADLDAAATHGIALHFVFAEGDPGHALLQQPAARAPLRRLVDGAQVSIALVPGADHTFTRLEARRRLVTTLDALMLASAAPVADAAAVHAPQPSEAQPPRHVAAPQHEPSLSG